jgi:hypothetical protein
MNFLRNFYAFLGKKRRFSGAKSRLFDEERQKITRKVAITEIVNRFLEHYLQKNFSLKIENP